MRVLIVDDEPAIRRTTRIAVETAGHRVHEASGLVRAERALKEEAFEAIFLDLKLADGDGIAFLTVIRGIQPAAAVVVVTAYARIADAVEAMRRGAYDFVPKPFTPVQIRSVLARIAAGSEASESDPGASGPTAEVDGPATLQAIEAAHIRRILTASRTLEEAASILGINPATLYRKRQGLGLLPSRPAFGLPC